MKKAPSLFLPRKFASTFLREVLCTAKDKLVKDCPIKYYKILVILVKNWLKLPKIRGVAENKSAYLHCKPLFQIPENDAKDCSLQMDPQPLKIHIGLINLYPEVPKIAKTTVSSIKPSVKAIKKRLRSETPKLINIGLPK